MNKVFLIGLPSSGKTTLGKRLATLNQWEFIDMDDEIVKHTGHSISSIFENDGEQGFRIIERELLKVLIEDSKSNQLISTGGGAPCFFDNMSLIKSVKVFICFS